MQPLSLSLSLSPLGAMSTYCSVVSQQKRKINDVVQAHDAALPQREYIAAQAASLRERLGDGIWLLLLGAIILPGLVIVALDSEYDASSAFPSGCASLYRFDAVFIALLSTLLVLHLIVWLAPRPVSHIDRSPLSAGVAAIVIGGPPVFFLWSLWLLVWPGEARSQCALQSHRGIWGLFAAVSGAGLLGLAWFATEIGRILWQMLVAKAGQ